MGRCHGIVGSRAENMSRNNRVAAGQFDALRGARAAHHRGVDKLPFPRPTRATRLPAATPAAAGPARTAAAPDDAARRLRRHPLRRAAAAPVLALLLAGPALAQDPAPVLSTALAAEVQRLVAGAAAIVWGQAAQAPRVEVEVGRLDPRLRLAPCQQVVPYLPAGARPLGRTRVGLRCAQGAQAWNVSLPVVVRLWAPSLAAATALPAGTVLEARHLVTAEVDLAERADPAIAQAPAVLGRTLARGLSAGEALRRGDLKTRQHFAAGDLVRIVAVGPGYAVSSEGQALGPGLEGQTARVRTDSGRVVTGTVTGDRRVELAL